MTKKEILRSICEDLYGDGDTSLVERYLTEDYRNHNPQFGLSGDRDSVRREVEILHDALSDIESKATHIVVEGDMAALRWQVTAKHTDELQGIPATGRTITTDGIGIYRFRDGKIAEEWHRSDNMGMMQQLGVLPEEFGSPA